MSATDPRKVHRIDDWAAFLKWYQRLTEGEKYKNKRWCFRGLSCTEYELETSLERAAEEFQVPYSERREIEKKLIREFKRRLHHYTSTIPIQEDTLEWLALMQHFGAPTRLLDWTYSFFVAAYFAMEKAKSGVDCAIWAIDTSEIIYEDKLLEKLEYKKSELIAEFNSSYQHQIIDDRRSFLQNKLVDHLLEAPKKLVHAVNPYRLNERLTIQQGLFLFPGDLGCSFMDNYNETISSKPDLIKFEINASLEIRKSFLKNLHRMNISRATLFPGLVGYANSMRSKFAFPELLITGD